MLITVSKSASLSNGKTSLANNSSTKMIIASAINLPSLPKFNSSATIAETSKIFAVTKSKIACNLPSEDKALIEKIPLIALMKSFEPSSVTN